MTQPGRIIPRLEGLETGERPVHMCARQCVCLRERGGDVAGPGMHVLRND